MKIDRQTTPPPAIGKIGRYTVFITPPATPSPQSERNSASAPKPHFEDTPAERAPELRTTKVAPLAPAPIMSPPIRSEKQKGACQDGSGVVGMFWNAVNRVQHAHSSLDDHLSRWFGLDLSKYQWALDDYHQSKGMAKGDIMMKDVSSKV